MGCADRSRRYAVVAGAPATNAVVSLIADFPGSRIPANPCGTDFFSKIGALLPPTVASPEDRPRGETSLSIDFTRVKPAARPQH